MTRKRFVKLLMARGYSRNSANATAKSIRRRYSYAEYIGCPFNFVEQATSSLCYPIKNYQIKFLDYLNAEGEYAKGVL